MRETNPLKTAIVNLKVGGVHSIPNDEKIRTNAHNFARWEGYKIKTQRAMKGDFINIVRVA